MMPPKPSASSDPAQLARALPTQRFLVEQHPGTLLLRVRPRDGDRLLHAGLWALRAGVAALGAVPWLVDLPHLSKKDTQGLVMAIVAVPVAAWAAGFMWELRHGAYTGPVHHHVARTIAVPVHADGYRADHEIVLHVDGREVRGPRLHVFVIRYVPRPRPGDQADGDRFVVCVALSDAHHRLEAFRTEPDARAFAEPLAAHLGATYDATALPEEQPLPPSGRVQLALLPSALVFMGMLIGTAVLLATSHRDGTAIDLYWAALMISGVLLDWLALRFVLRPAARRSAEERAAAILWSVREESS
jgi:hypothetical protein